VGHLRQPSVLILSNKWDIAVDYVVRELREREVSFARINTEQFPSHEAVVHMPDLRFVVNLPPNEIVIDSNLRSVWLRRPGRPFGARCGDNAISEVVARFCQEQWHAFVQGIVSIPNVVWINPPSSNEVAECKIVQLRCAKDCGFPVPKTLITSSKAAAEGFIDSCGGTAITKALYAPLLEYPQQDYFVFAEVIHGVQGSSEKALSMAPVIFQEYLQGKVDYRVTVVGPHVFVARIDSSNDRPIPPDWRTKCDGLNFVACDIPSEVKRRCRLLVKKLGLVFGAIDLAFDKGDFYFLEINPNGEWGWLQKQAGLRIAEAIAECLLTHGPESD